MGGKGTVNEIQEASGLAHSAIMRATMELQDEKLVRATEQKHTLATLTAEGRLYAAEGLPERRLMESLVKLGITKIDKAVEDAKLEGQLVTIAVGWLRKKGWAKVEKGRHALEASASPDRGEDEKLL
ncbi:MAG: hypothetical protein NWE81_00725, partial [Candidatus Bathyarchaeota archaeon]|nr:hypothetical protein [Candidatus Bathyarchaeota archaeon]